MYFTQIFSNLIKYRIVTEDVTLNAGINKLVSNCPQGIQWKNVIGVLPYISGSFRDVSYCSVGAYGGDGVVYFYVTSYWDDQTTTTAKIVWLYI